MRIFFTLSMVIFFLAPIAFGMKKNTPSSGTSRVDNVYLDKLNSSKAAPNRSKTQAPDSYNAQPSRNSGQLSAQEDEQERMEERRGRKYERQEQEAPVDLGNGTTTNTNVRE